MDAPEKASSPSPPQTTGRWRTLLLRSLILLVVIGLIAAFFIRQINQAHKRKNLEDSILQELKQPQKIALDAVAADSGVKSALGDDIKDAGGLARDGTGVLDRSSAVIHFDVAGNKGQGKVTASAGTKQGAWQVTDDIQVKLTDGKTITVPKPGDKPPDINLDF